MSEFKCNLFKLLTADGVNVEVNHREIEHVQVTQTIPLIIRTECNEDLSWLFLDQEVTVLDGYCTVTAHQEVMDGVDDGEDVSLYFWVARPVTEKDLGG